MATARCVAGSAATTALGAGTVAATIWLCRDAAHDLAHAVATDGWAGVGFEVLLAALAAVVVATGAAWLALATTLTALELVTGLGHVAAARITPAFLRRAVAAACGAALAGSTALAAHAADAPGAATPAQAAWRPVAAGNVLTGLSLPDRTTGEGPAPLEPRRPPSSPHRFHTVRPGDSLWSITAEALGARARAAELSAGWQRLYRANRRLVGEDPDLLLPGTILRLPATWAADRAEGTPTREDRP